MRTGHSITHYQLPITNAHYYLPIAHSVNFAPMAWFKKARKPIKAPAKASRVPEGLWIKCPSCGRAIFNKELVATLQVCPQCAHHFRMTAADRLNQG